MHKGDDMGNLERHAAKPETPPTSSPGKAASAKARSSRAMGASANRWVVLAAAGTLNALVGAVYVWSIFYSSLSSTYGWAPQATAFAYSLYIVSECCAGFLAGWLQNRMKPGILSLCGGCSFAAGWFFAGFADAIPLLYMTYSIMGGIGSGIIYNVSVSTATAWFPDKRGLANGVCVGTTGLSPIIFAPLGNFLITTMGVSMSFHICGIIFAVGVVVASRFLAAPPKDWTPENWIRGDRSSIQEDGLTTLQMLKKPTAYLMWLLFAVAASAGMMVIGHAAGISEQLAGLNTDQAAAQVGILAVANFAGRLVFASLSDRFGRYPVMLFCMTVTAATMAFFLGKADSFVSLTTALCVIGATFGGMMATMPALTADLYGTKHFGQNYAFMFSGYTCASIIGPMLAASVLAHTGSYLPAFPAAGALTCAGLVLVAATAFMAKREKEQKRNAKK